MVFGEVNTMYEELKDRIKQHEGFKLEPYQLSYRTKNGKKVKEDFFTGGYGHRLSKDEEVPTTKEGWDLLFEKDLIQSGTNLSLAQSPPPITLPALHEEINIFLFNKDL